MIHGGSANTGSRLRVSGMLVLILGAVIQGPPAKFKEDS
jgi:hypothetical protein